MRRTSGKQAHVIPSLRLLTRPACRRGEQTAFRRSTSAGSTASQPGVLVPPRSRKAGPASRARRGPRSPAPTADDPRPKPADRQPNEERRRPQAGLSATSRSRARRWRRAHVPRGLVEAERESVARGPTRSIFMSTVVDQVRPWLMPEQEVRDRRPRPSPGRHDEHERDRHAHEPAGNEHGLAAISVGQWGRRPDWRLPWRARTPSGRECRRAQMSPNSYSARSGRMRPLLPDHPADEGVDPRRAGRTARHWRGDRAVFSPPRPQGYATPVPLTRLERDHRLQVRQDLVQAEQEDPSR